MADSTARKPTEKEAFFFLTILGAMKNKPEVDWDLVAQRAGYNSGNTAKTRFGQIKKQIGLQEDGSISTPTPVKSRAKKENPVGSGTNTTPSKVAKKPATPRKPRTPKIQKGELAGLQAASESFLSGGSGGSGGNCGPVKYEDDDEDEAAHYYDPEDAI